MAFSGPGQVKLLPPRKPSTPNKGITGANNITAPRATPAELAALLFNFDIDSAGLKKEHKQWLDKNVVPPMTADSGAKLFMNGTASKSGANDHNLKLSVKRVEAVRDYLATKGVTQGRVTTSASGEELSTSKSQEASEDRAVNILLTFLAPLIRFDEFFTFQGFDGTAAIPWQMVPVAGTRIVRLVNDIDALTITSTKPQIATVRRLQSGLIEITGVAAGKCQIQASTSSAGIIARLDVTVKKFRSFKVAFHRVSDNKGHASKRQDFLSVGTMSSIFDLFTEMNAVITPQANCEFIWHPQVLSVNNLSIRRNLGEIVHFLQGEFAIVASHRNRGADLNVFFVNEYEQRPLIRDTTTGGFLDRTDAGTLNFQAPPKPKGDCLFEDDISNGIDKLVIAHEAGHFLMGTAKNNHSKVRNTLMFPDTGGIGRRIPRAEADKMNRD